MELQERLKEGLICIQAIKKNIEALSLLVADDEEGDIINECIRQEYPFHLCLEELQLHEWEEAYEEAMEKVEELEPTIPITYAQIKHSCGWSRYCDVTGGNHYAINEFGDYDDAHIFQVKMTHARKLNFI